MRKYMHVIKEEVESLKRFVLDQLPRLENNQVDALSKLDSSAEGDATRTVFWEVKSKKSINQEQVLFLNREQVWMEPIIEFKKIGHLLLDPVVCQGQGQVVRAMGRNSLQESI